MKDSVLKEKSTAASLLDAPPRARMALRRLAPALTLALIVGLLLRTTWTPAWGAMIPTITIALVATVAFTLLERWPRRIPRWLARWVLQVTGVGLSVPLTTLAIYVASTPTGAPPFWRAEQRLEGFMMLTVLGVLLAPWTALAALVRQKDAFARDQALAFGLEKSELERQALDARLHLLQAQVAPHFLFNTLANVQALVETRSPRASEVLRSLTVYLRAAVPQLGDPITTLEREVQLVKAYLELMQMRMPDRLQFELRVDSSLLPLQCPPLTLLTLVENAVRHGIDPSEEGGQIDVLVESRGNRCVLQVVDSGVGLDDGKAAAGTGLATLRERLRLLFSSEAELTVEQRQRGVAATVSFPLIGVRP